jgi:hypothetical protein
VKVKKVCPHASYNELPEVVLRGEAGRQPNSLLILCIMAAMTTLGVLISVYYHLVYRQAGHAQSLALQSTEENVFLYHCTIVSCYLGKAAAIAH